MRWTSRASTWWPSTRVAARTNAWVVLNPRARNASARCCSIIDGVRVVAAMGPSSSAGETCFTVIRSESDRTMAALRRNPPKCSGLSQRINALRLLRGRRRDGLLGTHAARQDRADAADDARAERAERPAGAGEVEVERVVER